MNWVGSSLGLLSLVRVCAYGRSLNPAQGLQKKFDAVPIYFPVHAY